jgi:Patatin-like phospholipase
MQAKNIKTSSDEDEKSKLSFDEVYQQELDAVIRPNRQNKLSPPNNLVGLAFSGGGIRSATFNLGVLQALADADCIKRIDYLSTVSGGGYVGSFFTSMLQRVQGDLNQVQAKLRTGGLSEANEINFLRQYSNYLTPKIGLSSDTFAALSVWFTNAILNQAVLISFLAGLSALVFFVNAALLAVPANWLLPFAVIGLVVMLYAGFCMLKESTQTESPQSNWEQTLTLGVLGAMLATGIVVKYPFIPSDWLKINAKLEISQYWLMLPIVIALISLGIIVLIGVAGRRIKLFNFYEKSITSFMREWWARLGGITTSISLAWLLVFLTMLYLPLLFDSWWASHPWQSITLASVWTGITGLAVMLGKSRSTSGAEPTLLKEKITAVLPWLVILGMLVLVSFGVFNLALGLVQNSNSLIYTFAGLTLVFLSTSIALSGRVDINIFSQHNFYRNRLTRAYLGATNQDRKANAFTGFDEDDDVYFANCVFRPYHIVNTTLNLTSSANLAWQQRKAAMFAFTPLSSGFEFPDKAGAYRPTKQFTCNKGVKVGSIMAVSGAAVCPNMGYHTSPAVAFLLTMFNARLGRWYGNPAKDNACWKRQSPRFGLGHLLKELFARSDENSDYLYLSDGGHFENLGIYELVRRHCRLVVALDVGQDANDKFEDLGNAIRKCQIDLGVNIDMRVDSVRKDAVSQLSPKHYAIGKINYPNGVKGVLIYIKSSLTGGEPASLQNFKKEQPAFPHHSTADQFFDEKQFESYRHLGYLALTETIAELRAALKDKISDVDDLNHIIEIFNGLATEQIAQSTAINTAPLP